MAGFLTGEKTMAKRIADVEDTFNMKMGSAFKLMSRRMLEDVVGNTTIEQITNQKEWEKFLLSD
jgi:hypothetical protein